MAYVVLFFLTVQFYALLNNRQLYYMLQKILKIIEEQNNNPDSHKIIILKKNTFAFFFYMASDLLYLLFCFWLIFTEKYWQQGGILFILTSLETYAFHARVDYTFDEAENGFLYPKTWLRCLFSGLTIYVLTRLYTSL